MFRRSPITVPPLSRRAIGAYHRLPFTGRYRIKWRKFTSLDLSRADHSANAGGRPAGDAMTDASPT
jgi:hypothetical protein